MIFEAFSGSKNFIFDNTMFVASKGSIFFFSPGVSGFGFPLLTGMQSKAKQNERVEAPPLSVVGNQ
jgi:hypothetical protein